jgi:hypothetical protein
MQGNDYPELEGMTTYIGTKIVKGKPMNRLNYNFFRSWKVPDDENPLDDGFIVQYEDGYISWSPRLQFDGSYRKILGMTFGLAIEAMRKGCKVSRAGWNGKGMWVIYNPGSQGQTSAMFEGSVYKKHGVDECEILPHFDMYTVNASGRRAMLPGWLASQSDMAAFDWGIVE